MKNGIPNYNEIVFTKEQKEEIVRLYIEEKLSTPKIDKIMGWNYNKIWHILDEFGVKRVNNGIRKYHINENYFDCIDTPNKAYVVGLMCADGCNFPPKYTANISLQESDRDLLERINKELENAGVHIETGIFGAMMKVSLINDGPTTIILDSKEII